MRIAVGFLLMEILVALVLALLLAHAIFHYACCINQWRSYALAQQQAMSQLLSAYAQISSHCTKDVHISWSITKPTLAWQSEFDVPAILDHYYVVRLSDDVHTLQGALCQ